jgi:outer membrane protein assembly factor BamB
VRIFGIGDIRETLRVPLEGYGLCMAASRGGKYIALGGMVPSQNGLIHLFDSSGKLMWRHKTREAISCVAISRTGGIITAASDDNNIYCFDRIGLLQWRHETSRMVKSMALSEAGDFLAAGGEDHNLYYFDKNRQIRKFAWKYKFEDTVTSVDISLSGRQIIAGSNDRFAAYFDNAGQLLWSQEAREPVNAVCMSHDGGMVAIGSSDHTVYVFNGTGMQVFAHDCGHPVRALAMSLRGDTVVAGAGNVLICLDSQGVRLWSVQMPSNILRISASESADTILVATDDKSLYLVTHPGALAWHFTSSAGIYGMAMSDDRELGLCCGPMELNHFENLKIFRELGTRHQGAITAAKREGQDTSAMEAALKQAISQLGTRSYPGAAESFKEVQDSLLAMEKISLERDNLRRDTGESIAKMTVMLDDLGAGRAGMPEDPLLNELRAHAQNAQRSFKAGKFSEALALVRRTEETAQALRQAQNAGQEVRRQIESVSAQVQASRGLDVDTKAAEADLSEARRRLTAGDIEGAGELSRVAAGALLSAKAGSPKAMEAEFDRACKLLASSTVTEAELAQAEEGLTGALALFIEKRDFTTLAESYERLAACWAKRPQAPAGQAGFQNAMLMAICAHRDAGKLDNAVALAKQMGDWGTAAKLLAMTDDRAREADAWVKVATARKPRPSIPDDLKEMAERDLSQGRYYDAADQLSRSGFLFEAVKVLARGDADMRSAVLMCRLLFNLHDFQELLERSKPYLAGLRKEAKQSGDSKDWANYAHMLVGVLEIANLLDAPESHLVMSELQEFTHDYTRGLSREEVRANEICDLTVLYTHLRERNLKAVERLAELKGGPFWEHLKAAVAAWKDVNIYLFKEQTKSLLDCWPGRFYYPTQTMPRSIWEGDAHEALSSMQPFNYPACVHQLLERFSNRDYLSSIANRADSDAAAGRDDRAAALYEQALGLDTFGLLDSKKLHMRISGIYISQRKDAEAAPHLEAARANRDAALAEYRYIRGMAPSSRKPAPKTLAGATPAKNACPGCGSTVPARAIRCFKCGAALR